MKILVVDDNPVHCAAAKKQLEAEHDLTVVDSYDKGQALLGYKAWDNRTNVHDFDVVLVDLMMPASYQMGVPDGGMEMPNGIFLAILAAKNGAKYVAVLTDGDHHSQSSTACFDAINESYADFTPFTVEGAQMLLCNGMNMVEDDESVPPREELCKRYDGSEYSRKIYQRIKRWDILLKVLLWKTGDESSEMLG